MRKHFTTLLAAAALAVGACTDDAVTGTSPDDELTIDEGVALGNRLTGVRVMTRNVYVGTDVDAVLAATSSDQIPVLAAQAFQGLLATDFRVRARLLAREIVKTKPHLIGLQEISTIRLQSPGDAVLGGTIPAETVLFDYLDILLQALADEQVAYRPVAVVTNSDVEIPMVGSVEPLRFDDVRLTDFDVILARHDVVTTNPIAQNFAARLSVPIGDGLTIDVLRGYTAVTARIDAVEILFVNTHLEPAPIPDLLPIQLAQAQELLGFVSSQSLPTVLVGDLNTHAPVGETYGLLIANQFVDVWTERSGRPNDGLTCCHASDLLNRLVNFDRRIDLVFYRGALDLHRTRAVVVGDERRNRSPEGLWPSDHGGVVAHLRFKPVT